LEKKSTEFEHKKNCFLIGKEISRTEKAKQKIALNKKIFK